MSNRKQPGEASSKIVLDDTLDISLIHDFYDRLKEAVRSSSVVEIDASNVSRIDTAAYQLLYSWYKSVGDKGVKIIWTNTEGNFYDNARLLGMHDMLDINNKQQSAG